MLVLTNCEVHTAKYSDHRGTPILSHIRDVRPEWVTFQAKNLRMGVDFWPKTCWWVIILIHETSELFTISIILPGNECLSYRLNNTYCSLLNFGSCSIVSMSENGSVFVYWWASFSLRMGQFNRVVIHPRTNEVEVGRAPRFGPQFWFTDRKNEVCTKQN